MLNCTRGEGGSAVRTAGGSSQAVLFCWDKGQQTSEQKFRTSIQFPFAVGAGSHTGHPFWYPK